MHILDKSLKRLKLINFSIRTKLSLIYLLCVLVPIIVFSWAFYSSVTKSAVNEKLILFRQALDRITSAVENNAISVIEFSNIIYADEEMYEYLNKEYTDRKECLNDYSDYLKDAWSKILPYNTSIVLFEVYTDNDSLLNSKYVRHTDSTIKRNDWYGKHEKMGTRSHFVCHVDELLSGRTSLKLVSFFRNLDYIYSDKYNHFLKVTFQADLFNKILKTESLPGNIYIVDSRNSIIAQSNREESGDSARFLPFETVDIAPAQLVLTSQLQAMDGWQVISVLDKDFMGTEFSASRLQILVLMLFVTVFASIIIFAISSSLYKRIDVLVQYMGKVEREEYVLIPEDERGNDEIGLLITSMNKMISKISTLIEDVYKAKLRETQLELLKKQTELNALQCQVNPHFMFNVLETIRIKAYLKNEFETSRIIKYMSKIFRKLLLWNEDLIELQEELRFIKEYLEIQQYRYEDELEFEITAEESLLSLKIPKMTLQTFVDNACEHGFAETKELKIIKISIKTADNRIELRVYDNGKGMGQDQINDINSPGSKGIGIKNVLGRLALYYGESYDLKINSRPGEFTEIILTLDMKKLRG